MVLSPVADRAAIELGYEAYAKLIYLVVKIAFDYRAWAHSSLGAPGRSSP
jgi:hypothetical protein